VGNLPITLYDLKQEVRLLSILNPGQLENQSVEDLQSLSIESLTIKKITSDSASALKTCL
jgi:hypothetical protein